LSVFIGVIGGNYFCLASGGASTLCPIQRGVRMNRIVRLMNHICERPGQHLARTDMGLLQAYVHGYLVGLGEDRNIDPELRIMEGFEQFIHSEFRTTEIADGKSWATLIRERADSEPNAFVAFRSLWARFLQSQSA
jgi:hypothetical protein